MLIGVYDKQNDTVYVNNYPYQRDLVLNTLYGAFVDKYRIKQHREKIPSVTTLTTFYDKCKILPWYDYNFDVVVPSTSVTMMNKGTIYHAGIENMIVEQFGNKQNIITEKVLSYQDDNMLKPIMGKSDIVIDNVMYELKTLSSFKANKIINENDTSAYDKQIAIYNFMWKDMGKLFDEVRLVLIDPDVPTDRSQQWKAIYFFNTRMRIIKYSQSKLDDIFKSFWSYKEYNNLCELLTFSYDDMITAGIALGGTPIDENMCRYCNYRRYCPYGKRLMNKAYTKYKKDLSSAKERNLKRLPYFNWYDTGFKEDDKYIDPLTEAENLYEYFK